MRRATVSRPVCPDPFLQRVAANMIGNLPVPFDRECPPGLARQAIHELGPEEIPGIASIALDVQLLRDAGDLRMPEPLGQERASALGMAYRTARDDWGRPVVLVTCLTGLRD